MAEGGPWLLQDCAERVEVVRPHGIYVLLRYSNSVVSAPPLRAPFLALLLFSTGNLDATAAAPLLEK